MLVSRKPRESVWMYLRRFDCFSQKQWKRWREQRTLIEIGDLVDVADVDGGKVLDAVRDAVEDFVLLHAVAVCVSSEADLVCSALVGQSNLCVESAPVSICEDLRRRGALLRRGWLGLRASRC